MSLGRIIIAIAIFLGINLFRKTEPKLLRIILVGFAISFLCTFFDGKFFFSFSFLSFGILALLYFVYCIYNKKWIPGLISVFVLILFIFQIQHWPYGSEIRLATLIPIILFLFTLFKFKKYENQISVLGIIVAYGISEFLQLF